MMRMYGGLILVQEEEYRERRRGQIILPQSSEVTKKFARGEVISVGPGIRHACSTIEYAKIQVEVGDTIVFHKRGALPFMVRGEEMLVVGEGDIVAVLDPEDLEDEGETDVTNN